MRTQLKRKSFHSRTTHNETVVTPLKKPILIFIVTLIILFSEGCQDVAKTTFGNHMVYLFISEDTIKEREYLLSKEIRKEMIKYTYKYEVDHSKNIELTYFPKTNTLNFGPEKFEETKGAEFKIDTISAVSFKKFHSTSAATDGTNPIFFNKDYGVLVIGNVMAPTFVLLPYKSDLKTAERIFKETLK